MKKFASHSSPHFITVGYNPTMACRGGNVNLFWSEFGPFLPYSKWTPCIPTICKDTRGFIILGSGKKGPNSDLSFVKLICKIGMGIFRDGDWAYFHFIPKNPHVSSFGALFLFTFRSEGYPNRYNTIKSGIAPNSLCFYVKMKNINWSLYKTLFKACKPHLRMIRK